MSNPINLFTYDLPKEYIAQRPVYPYDQARLLWVDRSGSTNYQHKFLDLPKILRAGDLLVFNDSKVIPARLYAQLEPSGAKVEVLLIHQIEPNIWEVMGKPLKKIRYSTKLIFSEQLSAKVIDSRKEKSLTLEFYLHDAGISAKQDVYNSMLQIGTMPIPPYIRKGMGDSQDVIDYQSIFAKNEGSVAAPTASLHFTKELLQGLGQAGICSASLTLHVGSASFLPLFDEMGASFRPPEQEHFEVTNELQQNIKQVKKSGGRVIAVGTTVVRALESDALGLNGSTELFIRPGFNFQVCDGIITNFHQPGTTHLALVEAFIGRQLLQQSYNDALSQDFRFLSYGDGMLLL